MMPRSTHFPQHLIILRKFTLQIPINPLILHRCITTNPPQAPSDYTTPLTKITRNKKIHPLTPPPHPNSFPPYEQPDYFAFELLHKSTKSNARVGRIYTPHGTIDTPGFVAVATNAALKAVDHALSDEMANQQLMFCNSYHLLLHPGPKVIATAGGLHSYMKRNRPLITDSGGFQVFSLAHGSVQDELNMKSRAARRSKYQNTNSSAEPKSLLIKLTEEGACFRSYRDGSKITLTPESSVLAQKDYGADIIIPLDELPPYHISKERLTESVYLTHRWEARSLNTHLKDKRKQAMYAVVHGGVDRDLRKLSAEYLTSLPFDGYAVGGSLGKDRDELMQLLDYVMPFLPKHKPNHLLGIADPESIERAVVYGVDTFDSCFPTRLGRHGTALTKARGKVQVDKMRFKECFESVDPHGWGITDHSIAYLHHLVKANEPMAATWLTLNNLMYMNKLMEDIRNRIWQNEI